jgi:hypothetical protein
VTNDAFDDPDVLLKYYEKQADEFRLRHAASGRRSGTTPGFSPCS